MNRRITIVLLTAWCFSTQLQAQEQDVTHRPPRYLSTQKKYTVAFQPFQLINNWGWRTDFEVRLGEGPGWLQFGSTFYYVDKDKTEEHQPIGFRESYKTMKGAGIEVNYKRFIDPWRGLYVAAGLSYNHFGIGYEGGTGTWRDYIEEGITYHEFSYIYGHQFQHIDRASVQHYVGYQIPSRAAFIFDVFGGISYRHSFSDKSKSAFNRYPFSYGYTGFVGVIGIRVGVGIK